MPLAGCFAAGFQPMVSIFRAFHPLRVAFLSFFLLGSTGCERKKETTIERTEPWRRDQENGEEAQVDYVEYVAMPGLSLSFKVPTRRTKPEGKLHGIRAKIRLDPGQLQFVEGQIEIDLAQIEMNDGVPLPKPARSSSELDPELEKTLLSSTWTQQAKNWLGIVHEGKIDADASLATFKIESARDLSHPRADAGAVREVDSQGSRHRHARQVNATAVGSLTMRHISVARSVPVRVVFFYDDEQVTRSSVPDAMEIELRGPFSVPLSEYEIEPRDGAGNTLSRLVPVVSRFVGSTVLLSGTLHFSKGTF